MDAYKPFDGPVADQKRKENKVVLKLNSVPGESNTDLDIGKTKTFVDLDPGPGETNTEDDLDETVALYDPKWERNTVQLAHNPYSKESIVQRKFSKMQFQLPHPSQVDPDDTDLKGQGGPKRLNVGPKDINKNFNYNNIKKNFVINREGADDKEEYEDFAFKWTDQRTKAKISSSSSMESSEEEEEGEEEAFECMQVDILIDLGCSC